MSLGERIEGRIGQVLLAAVRRAGRRKVSAKMSVHVDGAGRRTPLLRCGSPRLGTLVWLHGFSDRFDTMLQFAPHLFEDFEILSPSMPGFGEGWVDPSAKHTFTTYADWLEAIVEQIAPPRFHLMGNSLGGATVLALAARMPKRVQGVVALNSAGIQVDGVRSVQEELAEGHNLFEVRTRQDYARLGERLFSRPMKIPRVVETHLFREQHKRVDWHLRVAADLAESPIVSSGPGWSSFVDLPSIRVPTLVLWGQDDTLFPVAHARKVADVVPGAKLELLPGVGHCAHLESPKALAASFRAFAVSTAPS